MGGAVTEQTTLVGRLRREFAYYEERKHIECCLPSVSHEDVLALLAVAEAAARVKIDQTRADVLDGHDEFCCFWGCDCEERYAALEELRVALAALNGESPQGK